MILSAGSMGDTDIENRIMEKRWGEEENGEKSMEIYTLQYVK